MKIRRFNENQKYLTEPFDPESDIMYDISKYVDQVKIGLKYIAEKNGLLFKESDEAMANDTDAMFYVVYNTDLEKLNFYIDVGDDYIIVRPHMSSIDTSRLSPSSYETWEDVEDLIKEYFNL